METNCGTIEKTNRTRFYLSGLSLVLKKIDWPGVRSDLRYTPFVEVNQAINSLVVLDNG